MIVGIAASAVVVEASSLNISYGVPYVDIVSVGVSGIELGLNSVDCFNESLNLSGLG